MDAKPPHGEVVVYQQNDGGLAVDVRLEDETVWLTQKQMAELFGKSVKTISEHIRNVFKEQELEESSVVRDFRITAADGKNYDTAHYNLDVAISVGYRVKSPQGTRFRIWATQTLKEHLVKGYTVNQRRMTESREALAAALDLVRKVAHSEELTTDQGRGLIDVVTQYTRTYLLLQQYDEGSLEEPQGSVPKFVLTYDVAKREVARLKGDLAQRGEATSLFGQERGDALAALLGNLEQTVFKTPAYPSIEAKAAHLLYFVIKNHPFSDGNKRSGAYLFLYFLRQNGSLLRADGSPKLNDVGMAALALLVAESAPTSKETVIRLIMNMLEEPVHA